MRDPAALCSDLDDVAVAFGQARNALTKLADAVAAGLASAGWVQAPWEDPVSQGGDVGEWPRQWWGAHRSWPAERYSTSRFDWVLWGFDAPARTRQLRFGAGMTWSHWRGEPNPLHDRTWLQLMLDLEPGDRWGRFEDPASYDGIRLYRSMTLAELSTAPTLKEQAAMLVDLASSTFTLLAQHPPDHIGEPEFGNDGGH